MYYNLNEENKEKVLNLRHKDYLIKIKHSDVHSIIKRIRVRTSLTKEQIEQKIQNAINLMIQRIENNTLKTDKDICIIFAISKFKVILNVKESSKIIYLITILSNWMSDNYANRMILNEFYNHFDEDSYIITIDE
jgi:hypothetical protein